MTICEGPIVDVCAIGCEKGEIIIANLLSDEVIMILHQDAPVLSLSFASDPEFEKSLLASCSNESIIFWDMNEGKTCSRLEKPHNEGKVTKVQFLPGEPIIMS